MSLCAVVFFFKQEKAYEMRISGWSSDVFSSDLPPILSEFGRRQNRVMGKVIGSVGRTKQISSGIGVKGGKARHFHFEMSDGFSELTLLCTMAREIALLVVKVADTPFDADLCVGYQLRSEEHTSELQSLMR